MWRRQRTIRYRNGTAKANKSEINLVSHDEKSVKQYLAGVCRGDNRSNPRDPVQLAQCRHLRQRCCDDDGVVVGRRLLDQIQVVDLRWSCGEKKSMNEIFFQTSTTASYATTA